MTVTKELEGVREAARRLLEECHKHPSLLEELMNRAGFTREDRTGFYQWTQDLANLKIPEEKDE